MNPKGLITVAYPSYPAGKKVEGKKAYKTHESTDDIEANETIPTHTFITLTFKFCISFCII